MKKRFLIAGAVILALGAVAFVIGMSVLDWNFTALNSETWEARVYELGEETDESDGVNIVSIDVRNAAIVVRSGEKLKIEYEESEFTEFNIDFYDGTLSMEEKHRKLHIFSMFNIHSPTITLTLPKAGAARRHLLLETTNGAIDVEGDFKLIAAETTNGAVTISDATVENSVSVDATNGAVTLSNVTVTDFKEGSLGAHTTNGAVRLNNVKSSHIDIGATNGSVSLTDVDAAEMIASTVNGAIKATRLGITEEADIESMNGSITLSLTGDKNRYSLSADTHGDVHLQERPHGPVEIDCETFNGDITITFDE